MGYEAFQELCEKNNVRPGTVARATGIATSTMTAWKQGKYVPKADKLQKIATYFSVPVDIFYENNEQVQILGHHDEYYLDTETAKLAQAMLEDKDMRALFDMKKNMKPESFAMQMRAFKYLYYLEHPEEFPEDN